MPELLYRVHGRVQGVGFRWWVRSRARDLGLSGDVRNCPDGTVEVRARGDEQQLQALHDLLLLGPPASSVSHVERSEAAGIDSIDFEITG
jgi:acylphosphatase